MKINYSIALVLSCVLLQASAAVSSDKKMATALRRRALARNDHFFHPVAEVVSYEQPPPSPPSRELVSHEQPRVDVDALIEHISTSIKQVLSTEQDSSSSNDDHHDHNDHHDHSDDVKKDNRKNLIDLMKNLIEQVNAFLQDAGVDNYIEVGDALKLAEKGTLYVPPPPHKRGLLSFHRSDSSKLAQKKTSRSGEDGTEGDDQHQGETSHGEDGKEGDDQHRHETSHGEDGKEGDDQHRHEVSHGEDGKEGDNQHRHEVSHGEDGKEGDDQHRHEVSHGEDGKEGDDQHRHEVSHGEDGKEGDDQHRHETSHGEDGKQGDDQHHGEVSHGEDGKQGDDQHRGEVSHGEDGKQGDSQHHRYQLHHAPARKRSSGSHNKALASKKEISGDLDMLTGYVDRMEDDDNVSALNNLVQQVRQLIDAVSKQQQQE